MEYPNRAAAVADRRQRAPRMHRDVADVSAERADRVSCWPVNASTDHNSVRFDQRRVRNEHRHVAQRKVDRRRPGHVHRDLRSPGAGACRTWGSCSAGSGDVIGVVCN